MLRSFERLAQQPDAAIKQQATNAKDVVLWLKQADVKLSDAQQPSVSEGTRMDAAWDAVLMACLAIACAQGWRVTSDKGHHAMALEGAAQALSLSVSHYDELDTLRDWRNRKYRAGYEVLPEELAEAVAWVKAFLKTVAQWFADHHAPLLKRGVKP
jgi:hypothetical protein